MKEFFRKYGMRYGVPAITLFFGLHFILFSGLGWNLEFFPGDGGDARFNNYILEHGYRYISGMEDSFWNATFMYPEPQVVAYSDNLLGTMPIYAVFRWFGSDRETAFQLWIIVMFILNFVCAHAFLKWLSKNTYAAALGAFIFTFSIAMQSQMAHAQMFPRFFVPLTFWAVLLFYETLQAKHLILTVFALVGQFYAGIYLGFMLTVPIACIFLATVILRRKELLERVKEKKWMLQSGIGSLLGLLLLYLLMRPYIAISGKFDDLHYELVHSTIPTVESFFYSPHGSIWKVFSKTAYDYEAFWDHQIFPGGLAMLSAIAAPVLLFYLHRKKRLDIKWSLMLIAAAVTAVLFIRVETFSLYKLLFQIPGFNSMRSMTRIINVELLFFAFFATVLLTQVIGKRGWISGAVFAALLPLLCFENTMDVQFASRTQKAGVQADREALKVRMDDIPQGGVVSYEPDTIIGSMNYYHLDMMIAAQDLNLKSVNGYTARLPQAYIPYARSLTAENRKYWMNAMNNDERVYVIK